MLGGMLREKLGDFRQDESGGATAWSLSWFMFFCGMAGLTIDVTDGWRNHMMLQATADASALAGAIDTPNRNAAIATAVAYSAMNMSADRYGMVLDPNDVVVGKWDETNKVLDPTASFPDAVGVTLWRGDKNGNPVGVSFLRMFGLMKWNVATQAVAQRFLPNCFRKEGLIAANVVNISSNNNFVGEICFHGEQGVDVQSNNFFDSTVTVSMQDLADLSMPASGFDTNPGLQDALMEEELYPRLVPLLGEIMDGLLAPGTTRWTPPYIDPSLGVINETNPNKFDTTALTPGQTYFVECSNTNQKITIIGDVHDVVIVADCQIDLAQDVYIHNATIASRAAASLKGVNKNTEDQYKSMSAIHAASTAQLGVPDNCADGGGAQFLSNSDMFFSSGTRIDGSSFVAFHDIALGAAGGGINGISAQAGHDISLTSNGGFGLCDDGVDPVYVAYFYRLVK